MKVEEIEIIVTAKVEKAIKEFEKIVPAVAKVIQQVQKNLQSIDTKVLTSKVNKAVESVKNNIENLKKSNKNNEIKININNKEAQKQITQIQKQIDSLQEKVNARQIKLSVKSLNTDEINQEPLKRDIKQDASDSSVMQKTINNKQYTSLLPQENTKEQDINQYNEPIDISKTKMNQLGKETTQTGASQNKLTNFFNKFKEKATQAKAEVQSIRNVFSKMSNVTNTITNGIKKIGLGIKNGLGSAVKYVRSFLSLKNIYSILSSSAQSWLSSQNSGAQQLSANIEYMKYAMGGVFAPVIQTVVNLVYQLMKAIQSVVYAFSGINIFAKTTASSMNKTAGSANKANKALSGAHGEINNVSENSDGGGSSSVSSPNIDLSQMDSQMSPFAQKLHDFFKPLVDSWNTYGTGLIEQVKVTASQIGGLIASVWGSFENIITNGTVYSILENILAIIGNIAEAFSNAWNYNGNGDAIVQNLANAFNKLLDAINNVVKSDEFQSWLKWCSDKFKDISEKLGSINWQPLIDALETIGKSVGSIALEILNGLTDVFKWLVENPVIAEILIAIGIAIGVVSTALGILSTVMAILTPIATALEVSISSLILPILGIIAGIAAVIAIVVLVVQNWEWLSQKAVEIFNTIGEFFINIWQGICNAVKEIVTNWINKQIEKFEFIKNIVVTVFSTVRDFLINIWNTIVNTITSIIENIKNIIQNALNIISTIWNNVWIGISMFVSSIINGIFDTITNIVNNIKSTISNVLNTINNIWNNIWNGLQITVTNVFNGIWNAIKTVINWILGGIEKMGNGVVNGINIVIRALNRLSFKMPDWLGGGQFGFNIQTLNTISLPRLAKGNVAYSPLIAQFGEYSGASHNPEITAPQNILRETFDEVLSNHEWNSSNSDRPINLSVYVGKKKIGEILLKELSDIRRQTGKGLEALVN